MWIGLGIQTPLIFRLPTCRSNVEKRTDVQGIFVCKHHFSCFTSVYNERSICFGAECSTGLWNSPGYPNNYPNSFKGFYVIWVPQARYINITFSESFSIEKDRDALYVGPGFQYPLSLNTGPVSSQPGVVYQLDGYSSPGPVYILGDAAWLYFFTDDTTSVNGWQAAWEAGK